MSTTVKFSEREAVLLSCIQDTVQRGIKPQECDLICRFVILNDTLYLVTVHSFEYVTVENTNECEFVEESSTPGYLNSLEQTLFELLIVPEVEDDFHW